MRFIAVKKFESSLQLITLDHFNEVRKVIQRLGHIREGGSALDSRQAGSCLLLDYFDILLFEIMLSFQLLFETHLKVTLALERAAMVF